MNKDMKKWENVLGIEFLRKIGISSGDMVLDFGCKTGHYTIPAARIVGDEGIVYAIDKRQEVLNELEQKVKYHALKNIRIIKTDGKLKLNFKKESIDVVLAYDVLHYFKKDERQKLCKGICKILKPSGVFSVYSKHTSEDYPLMELAKLSSNEVKQEIENSGFSFLKKFCGILSHDDNLNSGCIFNFNKI